MSGFFERESERFMRPVVAVGFTEAKEATAVLAAQGGEQFIKADLDQARAPNDVDNCPHTLADRRVGDGESLVNSRFRQNDVTHPIVLKTNHRIGNALQLLQRFHCLRGSVAFLRR